MPTLALPPAHLGSSRSPDERTPAARAELMSEVDRGFGTPLFGYLLRYARGERPLAEDLLQETMLRTWRGIDSLPDEPESRRRWLFAIARHVAIDADRARRVRPRQWGSLDLNSVPADSPGPERVLITHTVRTALAQLSPLHKAVLVELYYADRSTAETAKRLGIPEGTVKSRAHHGLKALRAVLEP